jgi:putative heme-binding domain-containing protein
MGYRGGDVGPDLTRIGQVRAKRDLLEAIVFPSASFVRSYEPYSVVTREGTIHQGVRREEQATRVVLVNGQRQRVEITRSDIEEMQPSRVSIMPSGLDQLLSEQELADLLAFLESSR